MHNFNNLNLRVPTKKVFVGYEAKQAKNQLLFFNKKNKAEIALLPLVDFCTIFYYLFHLLFLPTATCGVPTKKVFVGYEAKQAKNQLLFFNKKNKAEIALLCDGCGGRTRTCDLWVMSPTSCHLLYPAIYIKLFCQNYFGIYNNIILHPYLFYVNIT